MVTGYIQRQKRLFSQFVTSINLQEGQYLPESWWFDASIFLVNRPNKFPIFLSFDAFISSSPNINLGIQKISAFEKALLSPVSNIFSLYKDPIHENFKKKLYYVVDGT